MRRRAGGGRAVEVPARIQTALDALRDRIDRLDEELVRLLNERAGCALSIGVLKRHVGMEIYQPDRERDVLRHVRAVNPGPLSPEAIARLFERIIDEARSLERHAHDEEEDKEDPG